MSSNPLTDAARELEDTVPLEGAPPLATGLRRKLSSFGVLLLTLSCLSPVFSVYGPGSDVMQHAGTGAAGLFLLGIGAALIWAIVYAELGSAYPYAGGDYVGVGSILGPTAGFACLALWAATILPTNAYLAKVTATYITEAMPGVPVDAVTFGALALAVATALLTVRLSALVTGLFLCIEMLAVLVLIFAGFRHGASGLPTLLMHPVLPARGGHWLSVGAGALAIGAVSSAYATVGGNQAIAFGEELIDPHRRMGRVIVIACLTGAVAIALPVIAVVVGAGTEAAIYRSPAPFSAFIASIAGQSAARALSACVALAIFNALIAAVMFSARLLFSFGRDAVFPAPMSAALARVHGPSGTPRIATLAVGAASAACCLLDVHVLLVFLSGFVVYGLALASLAVLVGRSKGLTGRPGFWRSPLFPLAPALGLALAATFAAAEVADGTAGRPSLLILGAVLVAAVLGYHRVLKRRPGGWAPRLLH
jgi:amino acid transporter